MSEAETIGLVLGVVFLLFSAFFSSSEAAFLSFQKTRLAHLVSTGMPGAERVAGMISQPERLLSTILLGNNFVNVAFTALVTVVIVAALGESRGLVVATVVGTIVLLIVGETIPKTLAVRHAESVAILFARPLKLTELMLWPAVIALEWTTHRVGSLFGGVSPRRSITEIELRSLIDIGEAEGTFEPSEAEMLENVFRFGDKQVREVMTPRTEIASLQRGATLGEFLDIYAKHSHTRFPVYKESTDDVVGIISAKDVLKAISVKGIERGHSVTDVIRDAHYVPETKRIAVLFDELRRSGNQMAIAVDEYGGLAGLVTLKRLSEEVVGPVGEEGAGPEEEYEHIDENTFLVDGGMSIEEVNEELEIGLPDGDYETIAGFVLDILGRIPREGELFDFRHMKFEITRMQGLKIDAIKLTKPQTIEGGPQVEADIGPTRRDPTQ